MNPGEFDWSTCTRGSSEIIADTCTCTCSVGSCGGRPTLTTVGRMTSLLRLLPTSKHAHCRTLWRTDNPQANRRILSSLQRDEQVTAVALVSTHVAWAKALAPGYPSSRRAGASPLPRYQKGAIHVLKCEIYLYMQSRDVLVNMPGRGRLGHACLDSFCTMLK